MYLQRCQQFGLGCLLEFGRLDGASPAASIEQLCGLLQVPSPHLKKSERSTFFGSPL